MNLPNTYHQSVSVVVPNYNNAAFLGRTLDSCLAQAPYLKEVIVVDDHSEDKSTEILSQYQEAHPKYIQWYTNPGKGGNPARNYAFSKVSGDFVQYLDSDDTLFPDKFAKQLSCFEAHPETDIVYSDWQLDYWKDHEVLRSEEKIVEPVSDYLLHLLEDKWVPIHTYLFRKSIAEKLSVKGGWDESYPTHQDTEYILKAAAIGAVFQYQAGLSVHYNRWNTQSVSQQKLAKKRYHWYQINAMVRRESNQRQDFSARRKKQIRSLTYTNQLISTFYARNLLLEEFFSIGLLKLRMASRRLKWILPLWHVYQQFRTLRYILQKRGANS